MKKIRYIFAALIAVAFASVVFVGCKKDNNLSKESNPTISKQTDLASIPVYFNEKLVDSFSEADYAPTKDADMDLTCVVDTNGQHYFNQDLIFNQFCTANQMELIYQYSGKLNLINQKAIELGIEEIEIDNAPQAMADYWQTVFGTSIDVATTPNRSLVLKVYDGGYWNGESRSYFLPCKANLGDMDNRISSFSQFVGVGVTVLCYNKWFGGTRRWFWLIGVQSGYSLENTADNNQYSSYFNILL